MLHFTSQREFFHCWPEMLRTTNPHFPFPSSPSQQNEKGELHPAAPSESHLHQITFTDLQTGHFRSQEIFPVGTITLSPCSREMSKCLWQQTTASSNCPRIFRVFPRLPLALASPIRSPMVLQDEGVEELREFYSPAAGGRFKLQLPSTNIGRQILVSCLLSQNCSDVCRSLQGVPGAEVDTALLLLQAPSSHPHPFLHLPALRAADPFSVCPKFSVTPRASFDVDFWAQTPQTLPSLKAVSDEDEAVLTHSPGQGKVVLVVQQGLGILL